MNRCSVNSCDFRESRYAARSLHLRTEQSKNVFNVGFFSGTKLLNVDPLSQHSPEAKSEDYLFGRLFPAVKNEIDEGAFNAHPLRPRRLASCLFHLSSE